MTIRSWPASRHLGDALRSVPGYEKPMLVVNLDDPALGRDSRVGRMEIYGFDGALTFYIKSLTYLPNGDVIASERVLRGYDCTRYNRWGLVLAALEAIGREGMLADQSSVDELQRHEDVTT